MISGKNKPLYDILRIAMASLDRAIHSGDCRRIRIEFDHLHNLHEYLIDNEKNGTKLYLNLDAKLYAERMDREYPDWRSADTIGRVVPEIWEKMKSD
jgi:hypothetical protein